MDWDPLGFVAGGSVRRIEEEGMTKAEFDRQRQLFWVYLRRQGKCAICGQEVSRAEAAISTAIPVALGIDELLQLELMHSRCKLTAAVWTGNLAA